MHYTCRPMLQNPVLAPGTTLTSPDPTGDYPNAHCSSFSSLKKPAMDPFAPMFPF